MLEKEFLFNHRIYYTYGRIIRTVHQAIHNE